MTPIRMLLLISSLGLSVAKQMPDKAGHKGADSSAAHPNSVYSQMHPKHSRKAADMKIFYQTGVRTIHKSSICDTRQHHSAVTFSLLPPCSNINIYRSISASLNLHTKVTKVQLIYINVIPDHITLTTQSQ